MGRKKTKTQVRNNAINCLKEKLNIEDTNDLLYSMTKDEVAAYKFKYEHDSRVQVLGLITLWISRLSYKPISLEQPRQVWKPEQLVSLEKFRETWLKMEAIKAFQKARKQCF